MHAESKDLIAGTSVEQGGIALAPGMGGDAEAALADTGLSLRPQEDVVTIAGRLSLAGDPIEPSAADGQAKRHDAALNSTRGGVTCDQVGPLSTPIQDESDRPIEGDPANPDASAQPDPEKGDAQHPNGDAESCDDEDGVLAALEERITAAGDPPIALRVVRSILMGLVDIGPSPLLVERALGLLRKASGIRIEVLRQEYAAAIFRDKPAAEHDEPEETPEERAARRAELWALCSHLATKGDILAAVRRVVQEQLGIAGEDRVIELTYLAGTSRVLDRPVSPLIKGPTCSGKSVTTERTLRLFPEEAKYVLTAASSRALIYGEEPIRHKVLVIYEATPLNMQDDGMFAMLVRTLISEGRIVYETTVKDEVTGRFTVERIVRDGPVALVVTTTASSIHAENETRMLALQTDASAEQTRRIMAALAREATVGGRDEPHLSDWHALQAWIALSPTWVMIPYAERLAGLTRPTMVRYRRDFGTLLNLIAAHALLHQATRAVDAQGRVVATVEDYAAIRPLIAAGMEEAAGQAPSENTRRVVEAIAALLSAPSSPDRPTGRLGRRAVIRSTGKDVTISSRALGERLGLDDMTALRAARAAIDAGYLVNHETRPRVPMRLAMGSRKLAEPDAATLPTAEALAASCLHPQAPRQQQFI